MKRHDGREPDQIRKIRIERNYLRYGEGAVLIEAGHTRVICTATVEDRIPRFRRESGEGWVTAEYGMLPRSSQHRIPRETRGQKGRTQEIQRLIGRSLRAVVDMKALGLRSVVIDCDVIQADGGTRTASITGAYVALVDALRFLEKRGMLADWPMRDSVSAVSVGMVDGAVCLDLDYVEDFAADVDMNVVMTGRGRYVEVQGTAEGDPFPAATLQKLLKYARSGCTELAAVQEAVLAGEGKGRGK